ncbi:MAG: methyltransferase domain-containing protein [Deferribacteres bacterium]|nr:methyltransferase domain-containing protein [Deferribacteres bacterium]
MNELKTDSQGISLVCPLCKSRLSAGEDSFICPACNRQWPSEDGIVNFSVSGETYWGEYAEDVMDGLVLRCREAGWKTALREFFAERDPSYYDYIIKEGRADWHFIIPLDRDARILDAGCGWGTLSFALARMYREIVALDAVRQRVQFIDIRRNSENAGNIFPVHGQVNYMPFPDEYFDLVVFNGVLEWIPCIEKEKEPCLSQMEALDEARRVLKKGGYLYLAIENRWSAMNFLGFRDPHSGLRFAPLLPRSVANIYSRRARGRDFREYTYTYGEHRRMLRDAGFTGIRFYAPLPSYRNFYYILPVDDPSMTRFFLDHLVSPRNNLQRFFVSAARLFSFYRYARYFVPDFSIVARK